MKTAAGVTYAYDGDGRRVSKSTGKLYWYGSGGEILAETDGSGNTQNEYIFFGGKRVAMLPAGSSPLYYVEDMLGSSRVITTSTGVVCYDADFYPYGGEASYTNSCAQNYKFEGKERDGETQNDEFGARSYSWRFGRWLSTDWSNVPVAVPYANLTNPQTLNLYAMVADDPESFADLDGHYFNTGLSQSDSAHSQDACAQGILSACNADQSTAMIHEAEAQAAQAQNQAQAQEQSPYQKYIEQQNRPVTDADKANALIQAGKMGDAGVKAGLVVVGGEAAIAGAVVAAPAVAAAASPTITTVSTAVTNASISAYVATTSALATAGTAISNTYAGAIQFARQAAVTIDTLKSGGGAINAAANFVQGYRASTSLAPRQPPPQNSAGAAGFLVGLVKRVIAQ
jgi:RHS repeat-associated protein